MQSPPVAPPKTKLIAGQVVGGAVGIVAGTYSGIHLLIPGVALAAIWHLGSKHVRLAKQEYLLACAVQGAHLVWLAVGMALLGAWGANLIDILVLGVGVIWLWRAPSILPIVLLTLFQLFALFVNITLILRLDVGTVGHRSLVVHIALRLAAIAAMWWPYARTRKAVRET